MPKIKLYQSERYLRKRFVVEKKTQKEIAQECGVTQQIISLWLKKFGFIK